MERLVRASGGLALLALVFTGCVVVSEPECTSPADCGGGNYTCSRGECVCLSSCPAYGPCNQSDGCGGTCFSCDSNSYCGNDGNCYCDGYCPSDGPCDLTDGCGEYCFICDPGYYCANDGYCYY